MSQWDGCCTYIRYLSKTYQEQCLGLLWMIKFFATRVYPSFCSWISSLSFCGVLAILHKTGFKQHPAFCSVTMKILECKLRVLSRNPYLFLKSLFLTVHGVFRCLSTFWWRPSTKLSENVLQIVLFVTVLNILLWAYSVFQCKALVIRCFVPSNIHRYILWTWCTRNLH